MGIRGGIAIYKDKDISSNFPEEMLEKYGSFIVEELINQSPGMGCLHPQSINTVRVATVKTDSGIQIYGAALRMGVGGNTVDNAGAGGIYAGIDIEHGVVISKGKDNRCNVYTVHPDSHVVIPGFKIPNWEELKNTVCQASNLMVGAVLLAWDMALSSKGWCIVEVNDIGEQYLLQVPEQKGIKKILTDYLEKLKSER